MRYTLRDAPIVLEEKAIDERYTLVHRAVVCASPRKSRREPCYYTIFDWLVKFGFSTVLPLSIWREPRGAKATALREQSPHRLKCQREALLFQHEVFGLVPSAKMRIAVDDPAVLGVIGADRLGAGVGSRMGMSL